MGQLPATCCSGPLLQPEMLKVSMSVRADYTVVSLHGEGDVTVHDRLRAALTPAAAGTRDLVVDLSGLDFIDASCVRVLFWASRLIQQGGGRVGLAAPRPSVARVLQLLGADRVVGVHDSVAKAVIAAVR